MATVTLDFTASYRAIADADLTLPTVRDTIGFGGNGVPIPAITFTSPSGNVTLPGYDYYADETAYVRSHSPFADHLDLIDVTS